MLCGVFLFASKSAELLKLNSMFGGAADALASIFVSAAGRKLSYPIGLYLCFASTLSFDLVLCSPSMSNAKGSDSFPSSRPSKASRTPNIHVALLQVRESGHGRGWIRPIWSKYSRLSLHMWAAIARRWRIMRTFTLTPSVAHSQ